MVIRSRRLGGTLAAFVVGGIVGGLAVVGGGTPVAAQEGIPGMEGMDPEMVEAMEAYFALGAPGAHHELLHTLKGTWTTTTTMTMGPDAPPIVTNGRSTYEPALGGRWMQQSFDGEMMGMPYEGFGMLGYDNHKKQFVSTWYDGMTTSMMVMYGSMTPGGNQMVFVGQMDEPMTGEIGKHYLMRLTMHGADHHTLTMEEIIYGDPFTVMTIEYRRAG